MRRERSLTVTEQDPLKGTFRQVFLATLNRPLIRAEIDPGSWRLLRFRTRIVDLPLTRSLFGDETRSSVRPPIQEPYLETLV